MKYRKFGTQGWDISEVGYGMWGMGGDWAGSDDKQSLESLQKAVELEPQNIRYAYVYAVALDSTGKPEHAIEILTLAHEQRPADRDVLYALISFHQKAGNIEDAKQ